MQLYEQVLKDTTINFICKLCHDANNELMVANGETPCGDWDTLDDHLKQMTRARDSVQVIIDNPSITAEDIHNTWMDNKRRDGWVYGATKDANKKTHPLMIPFDDFLRYLTDQWYFEVSEIEPKDEHDDFKMKYIVTTGIINMIITSSYDKDTLDIKFLLT